MFEILKIIGRENELFSNDLIKYEKDIKERVSSSSFLVIGGAGSIGQAVVREIFSRNPKILHVVDISENNLVELVRDIRSSLGYIDGDFRALPLDCGSLEFDLFLDSVEGYDYILNLSALKHVRSEKDPFSLMRMINVNIFNTNKTVERAIEMRAKKYFCVSTDKAANPVNMMGASKRIMEMFLMRYSLAVSVSTARFANVAFSDGSLLHGFNQRLMKRQPLSAPMDVKRYFITPKESGELCILSCLLGDNRDIFFPKLSDKLHLMTFSEIAVNFLKYCGYEPHICSSEDEARGSMDELLKQKKWPCYFFISDTAGEKDFEEFFTKDEVLDVKRFDSIGIIKNEPIFDDEKLDYFPRQLDYLKQHKQWNKESIVRLFNFMIPNFDHKETGKYLDNRM